MKKLEKQRIEKVLAISFVVFSIVNGLDILQAYNTHSAEFIKGLCCGLIMLCVVLLFRIKRLENKHN